MPGLEFVIVAIAGTVAGFMNAAVGAGTLATFPVLVALGLPPLQANVTSAVGIFPGNISGSWTYRSILRSSELRQPARIATLAMMTGALMGIPLLLLLPPRVFAFIVPGLIIAAGVLTLVQPLLTSVASKRGSSRGQVLFVIGLTVAGVYLSYFGAATGVITLFILVYTGMTNLQHANAVKNIATGVAGIMTAGIFLLFAPVHLGYAVTLAVGAFIGGFLGGRFAQMLSPTAYRAAILIVALIAAVVTVVNSSS